MIVTPEKILKYSRHIETKLGLEFGKYGFTENLGKNKENLRIQTTISRYWYNHCTTSKGLGFTSVMLRGRKI